MHYNIKKLLNTHTRTYSCIIHTWIHTVPLCTYAHTHTHIFIYLSMMHWNIFKYVDKPHTYPTVQMRVCYVYTYINAHTRMYECVYMYVYIYIYIYIYIIVTLSVIMLNVMLSIYIYTYICVCVHVFIYIYIYIYKCFCLNTHLWGCVWTYIHIHTCTYICTNIHIIYMYIFQTFNI